MTGDLCKVIHSIETFGLRTTLGRIRNRLFGARLRQLDTGFVLNPQTRRQQAEQSFPRTIRFSILVPLYNTPPGYLKEMIESVLGQTYQNWELCLADASDEADATEIVRAICAGYQTSDERIRYQKLEQNAGIAANTNHCLRMATGDYFALLDHDDVLHPSALFAVMEAICEQDADMVYTDEITFTDDPSKGYNAHFKPDFSPDTLRSYNYITHLTVFSRQLQMQVGDLRSEFDGSQDYDLILRLSEKAQHIVHIPKILYYWRAHPQSVAAGVEAKTYAIAAAKHAISEHLGRVGLRGQVRDAAIPTVYRIEYDLAIGREDAAAPASSDSSLRAAAPLVSIIIPNKDHIVDLDTCLKSIMEKTSYPHYEILIVENNSTETKTFAYYQSLLDNSSIEVLTWAGAFNFSAINNYAAEKAQGQYLLFLNNDTEVITPDWIEQMLMFAQRADVGVVGAKLYYPDNTIQHAGVILGIGGVAGHSHKHYPRHSFGYVSRLQLVQNVSAVTAACMMVKRTLFEQLGGFDLGYSVAFNDVDFCMRLREAGLLNIFTPYAELYHHESKSRGIEDTPQKQKRFSGEVERFKARWRRQLAAGDSYYNPNLSLEREDFSLRVHDIGYTEV
ncbi:MAG: glycosyltransferase family 2 protein [Coriobacteriaceae bacterium]|nr:glycosyltransferase family 2 protein [Coriobacteriaceae bacterium]